MKCKYVGGFATFIGGSGEVLTPSVVSAAAATLATDALTMADAVAARGGGGVVAGGEATATGSRGGGGATATGEGGGVTAVGGGGGATNDQHEKSLSYCQQKGFQRQRGRDTIKV
eukprot:13215332-Ditylum_brightwellii.AAC.1